MVALGYYVHCDQNNRTQRLFITLDSRFKVTVAEWPLWCFPSPTDTTDTELSRTLGPHGLHNHVIALWSIGHHPMSATFHPMRGTYHPMRATYKMWYPIRATYQMWYPIRATYKLRAFYELRASDDKLRVTTEDRPRTASPLAGIVIALTADGLRTRRLNIPSLIKNLQSFWILEWSIVKRVHDAWRMDNQLRSTASKKLK